MRGSVVLLLTMLAGCDNVFGLYREAPETDAGADAASDAPRPCWDMTLIGDEDADSRTDGCDLCPADPDVQFADSDDDGVGDECDPEPAVGNSKLVAFDGFAGSTFQWTTLSGLWAAGPVDLDQTTSSGVALVRWMLPAVQYPAVDVRLTSSPCPNACGSGVSIELSTQRVGCMYEYNSGPDTLSLTVNEVTTAATTVFPEASPDRIVLHVVPPNLIVCRAYRDGQMTGEVMTGTAPWAMTTTRVGLFTRNATASFHSVTVLGAP